MDILKLLYVVKSNVGLTRGLAFQVDSLFHILIAMHDGVVSDETRKAFLGASRSLLEASENLLSTVDSLIENDCGEQPARDTSKVQ